MLLRVKPKKVQKEAMLELEPLGRETGEEGHNKVVLLSRMEQREALSLKVEGIGLTRTTAKMGVQWRSGRKMRRVDGTC